MKSAAHGRKSSRIAEGSGRIPADLRLRAGTLVGERVAARTGVTDLSRRRAALPRIRGAAA